MTARRTSLRKGAALAALLASGFALEARATNLVTNPGFESPSLPTIVARYACACVPSGFGWTVGGAGVDLIRLYWAPQEGSQSLDLNQDIQTAGTPPGAGSQEIATTPGTTYTIGFWMAANPDHSRAPDDGPALKTMDVTFGATTNSYSFDVTASTLAAPGWTYHEFDAVASSAATTLSFVSTTTGYAGAAIDNVSVTASAATSAKPGTWGRLKSLYR